MDKKYTLVDMANKLNVGSTLLLHYFDKVAVLNKVPKSTLPRYTEEDFSKLKFTHMLRHLEYNYIDINDIFERIKTDEREQTFSEIRKTIKHREIVLKELDQHLKKVLETQTIEGGDVNG